MDVAKLRVSEGGLTPVGTYFQRVAEALRDANAADAHLRQSLDAEDRALERRFAKKPQKRTAKPAAKRRSRTPILKDRAAYVPGLQGSL